ncbi:MAG TPA: hypothetical protein VNH11_29375 [Pirellulales bacterium]|nr:hypothetical protein [Pirellulales bacterium]
MIRRTVQYPSGEQRWILISQIVHARVAATLADEWVDHQCEPTRRKTDSQKRPPCAKYQKLPEQDGLPPQQPDHDGKHDGQFP